jgi:hypothetical protein
LAIGIKTCPGGVVGEKSLGARVETCGCSVEERKLQVKTEERAKEMSSLRDRKRILRTVYIIARAQGCFCPEDEH